MSVEKLSNVVNQSGFPLQLGIAQAIDATTRERGWSVLYTEHAWKNANDGASGFLDLAIQDRNHTIIGVVECKRVGPEANWIFLQPGQQLALRQRAKTWVKSGGYFGWFDITCDAASAECAYCVVDGQDPKARPMLERVASDVVSATAALAAEETALKFEPADYFRMYISVIVTTAQLKVCTFDPAAISLVDGRMHGASFEDVGFVRFRKQLSTHISGVEMKGPAAHQHLVTAKEHTVFVVNAENLLDFLGKFELHSQSVRPLLGLTY